MKPIKTTQLDWHSPDVTPEYGFNIMGKSAVQLLIKLKAGAIFEGDYTDGNWNIMGVTVKVDLIDCWCYFPI